MVPLKETTPGVHIKTALFERIDALPQKLTAPVGDDR